LEYLLCSLVRSIPLDIMSQLDSVSFTRDEHRSSVGVLLTAIKFLF
jgi:hypothetical protein